MTHKAWISLLAFLLLLTAVVLTQPVSASPQPQVVYQTPTAYADGRIIYLVQANDTCLRIELLTKVTVEQLRTLNKLDQDCTLTIGKELLLGFVTPVATITPNPQVTPSALLPTPTAYRGNGQLCVVLFNDVNGNAFHEDTEPLIPSGAVSISDRRGQISETGATTNSLEVPFCKEVPEGDYTVSVAIPDGHNATNETNVKVPVQAGDQVYVDFGAQVSSKAIEEIALNNPNAAQATGSSNIIMAVLGGLFLLLGAGLGVYVLVIRRGSPA
jgi:hypothetical protein